MSAPLDAAKVAAYIADREAEIEAQRAVYEKLQQLADDQYRELSQTEGQLREVRRLVAERGTTEATA